MASEVFISTNLAPPRLTFPPNIFQKSYGRTRPSRLPLPDFTLKVEAKDELEETPRGVGLGSVGVDRRPAFFASACGGRRRTLALISTLHARFQGKSGATGRSRRFTEIPSPGGEKNGRFPGQTLFSFHRSGCGADGPAAAARGGRRGSAIAAHCRNA